MKKIALILLIVLTAGLVFSSCMATRKSGCPANMYSNKPFRA